MQSNSTEPDKKVCNLKSQLSRSGLWGHNKIAPKGQGTTFVTSVSFKRIVYRFCLPGKKRKWANSSTINKTPDSKGSSNLFSLFCEKNHSKIFHIEEVLS